MIRAMVMRMLFAALLIKAGFASAQEQTAPPATAKGSTAFCLYELPPDDDGKRRWLNLGIVQYVEFTHNELRIYYGGGRFGSGYEARLPVPKATHVDELLDKIRQAAASCR